MEHRHTANNGESLLIQRIKEGEEYAFEIAFLKYHSPLCRFTWKYVRSKALSREIVQEVFADVWEDREDLDPDGHLRGFLYEMARNKALNYIKHQKIVDDYISEARQRKKVSSKTGSSLMKQIWTNSNRRYGIRSGHCRHGVDRYLN